ncbi:MAG: Smr/MutS family protein [Oscillospiraceae bacterium]|jgi:DNA-nicking Smr family endonuclease|nr:Smr/MutS family protein [Oscillospiraceae bacterium]
MAKQITADIHGMTATEAKKHIERLISAAPADCERLVVIHGCNSGTVLRDTVRRGLRHKRILEIIPTFSNDGETSVYLKGK